jgi:hypothetical protein
MGRAKNIRAWLVVLALATALVPVDETVAQAGWHYMRIITIHSSQVPSDLADFPVVLNLSETWLRDTGHGGHVGQADGGDILFTLPDDTPLDHEIEFYNATSGNLVVWVRVPSLSGSADTLIRMYYGNATCPDQWNPAGVWDAGYTMVQHLQEETGPREDSTAHNNDGLPLDGVLHTSGGQIDGADDFDGNLSRLDCGTGSGSWRNQEWGQQRAVIKDGKVYSVGGGDHSDSPVSFSAYIFVFDLFTGDLLQQSPPLIGDLDFTASETAPVVDGDMVYAAVTMGNVYGWNQSTDAVWSTTGLSVWSNRMEFDGTYLFATTSDYQVVKIDTDPSSPTFQEVVATFALDPDTDGENAVPPYLDQAAGVVFGMGASNLYKLSAADLSLEWSRPIGSGCLDTGPGHSRMAPIVVNDAYTGNEPWVILGCWGNSTFYAFDYDGNQEWNPPVAIPGGVRAVASYNPNEGLVYIPSRGDEIFVFDIANPATTVFTIDTTDTLGATGFDRPCTIVQGTTQDYLIFKTAASNPRYLYIFDASTGAYITRHALSSDPGTTPFLTCFPVGVSQGYLVTGGSVVYYNGTSQTGGVWAIKAGHGLPVDYYPLYGPDKYGYLAGALTDLEHESSLNPTEQITLEAWAEVRELSSGSNDHLVCKAESYCLKFAQGYSGGDQPRFQLYGTDNQWHVLDRQLGPLLVNEPYYLAGTWDGSTMLLYVNGDPQYPRPTFQGSIATRDVPTFIASYSGGTSQAPAGIIDEVRISRVARSEAWIQASYHNQSAPETFYEIGTEEPTAVKLVSFTATPDGETVILAWETATEIDHLGFNLYRSQSPDGAYSPLNSALIPSPLPPGSLTGAAYTWADEDLTPGLTYYYQLEDVDIYGVRTKHGPVWATVVKPISNSVYLPLVACCAGDR